MKPIKRVSDPDGTKQEADALDKVQSGLAALEAMRIKELLRIVEHFHTCGVENNDPGLIAYAEDMAKIVERKEEQKAKDVEKYKEINK